MVLAYLRGLLKPDYPMGIRSHIREDLMLNMLGREINTQEQLSLGSTLAAYACAVPGRAETLTKLRDSITTLQGLLWFKDPVKKTKVRNIDGLQELFQAVQDPKLFKR